jgi:ABC-type nitrate/sulfonate/bicarbonate transport system substrate-binding protein/predicted Ser/Thr protein kinase
MNAQTQSNQLRELFDAAAELPPGARRQYLDQHCSDAQIRERVLRLLAADTPLDEPLIHMTPRGSTLRMGDDETRRQSPPASGLPEIPGFEVRELIGRGGMGIVYKARQLALSRVVALKMLPPEASAAERSRRFRTEASAVARLQHPGIVQIYSLGEHEGREFLELEYIDGGSLADRLDGQPWSARDAAGLIAQLAWAIHAAHERGIVHRDLKPSNVLLVKETQAPKVADFGLARMLDSRTQHTETGQILGTPCYMAPEQAAGDNKSIGPATDIYALGAILYQLLAGVPPFQAQTPLALLEYIRHREPVAPRRLHKRVPRDLENICLKCLAKEPDRRYATAEDLARDLENFLAGRPVNARPVGALAKAWRHVRRRPVIAGLTAAVAVMAATLAAVLVPLPSHTIRVGIKPWVGSSPLAVAKELQLCPGVDVELVPVESLQDAQLKVTQGKIDVALWLACTHVLTRSGNTPTKAVLKLDVSIGADAVIARRDIHTIGDLRGKRIAYEHHEAQHTLILALCDKHGLDQGDFELVATSAKGAADMLLAGEVDAAVTYEPWVQMVFDKEPGQFHLLATSKEVPGEIVDILTVDERFLANSRPKVKALIAGWFAAVERLERHDPQAVACACKFLGDDVTPADYDEMASGIEYGDLADNLDFFRVDPATGNSPFRDLMSRAQNRWDKYHHLGKRVNPADGDASEILFEMYDRPDAKNRS